LRFERALLPGRLIRRYKRFLADVDLGGGRTITAVCPNTGSMMGCCEPGNRVWLSESGNPSRKYAHTWEIVETRPRVMVGINTALPNKLVRKAIDAGVASELSGYREVLREVRYGHEGSRIDLLLRGERRKACYVEVKNVTAAVERGVALFPDAVTERGTKHLRELIAMVEAGHRAVLFFCVQRGDVDEVRPADQIDPEYGATLRRALEKGVEALAYRARVSVRGISLEEPLPVVCP
jgi:sugar fermentation stimulation protein A